MITLETRSFVQETHDKESYSMCKLRQKSFVEGKRQQMVCIQLLIFQFKQKNKPGTAQVGVISKAQKDSKTTFSTTGDNKSSQKTKN